MHAAHSNDSHVHQEQTEHLFEQQNNELVDSLYDKVDLLKKITIDIGNEVREQNKFLDGLVRTCVRMHAMVVSMQMQ